MPRMVHTLTCTPDDDTDRLRQTVAMLAAALTELHCTAYLGPSANVHEPRTIFRDTACSGKCFY